METFDWKESFAKESTPLAVLVVGLPRVGKSTVARQISQAINGAHISTDEAGSRLFKIRDYSLAYYRKVYSEMERQIKKELSSGASVVVDGTFLKTKDRLRFYKLFQQLGINFLVVLVKCDEEVIKQRCAQGSQESNAIDYSQADYEVYLMRKTQLEVDLDYSYPVHDGVRLIVVETTTNTILKTKLS